MDQKVILIKISHRRLHMAQITRMSLMSAEILANMDHMQHHLGWYCDTVILQVSRIKLKSWLIYCIDELIRH